MEIESAQMRTQPASQQQPSISQKSKTKDPAKQQGGTVRGEYCSKKLKKECILSDLKVTQEKFKEFQAIISAIPEVDTEIKAHYERFHDDILFKKLDALDVTNLLDQFEKILQKAQSNFRTSKKNWNEEETIFLISAVTYWTYIKKEDHKKISDESWREIASVIPRRDTDQIKQRWNNLLKIYISKDPWTPEEDKLITTIIESMKDCGDWKSIAKELNLRNPIKVYRSAKQCRERWNNHIDPCINRGPWIKEHDLKLVSCYLEVGKKWSQIAKELSNRTENAVKNRWHSLMRRVGLVNTGNFEMSDGDEKEKAKQLLKLIINETIYERGDKATSGEELLSPQVKKEEFLEDEKNDEEDEGKEDEVDDDEDGDEGSRGRKKIADVNRQQSTLEATGALLKRKSSSEQALKQQIQEKKANATSDVDPMLDKIRKSKDLLSLQGRLEPKASIHVEAPENHLLRNLSYVSNPKPSLHSFGELQQQPAAFLNSGPTMALEMNHIQPIVQLNHFGNSVNYQLTPNFQMPYLNANGNSFPFQVPQTVTSIGKGFGQIATPAPSMANGYHFYGYQQHQMPVMHQIVADPRASVPTFDLRNGQEASKEPLLRSLGELEANARNKSQLSTKEAGKPHDDMNLKVQRFNMNSFSSEGLQFNKGKYQFAILNRDEGNLMLLDPVSVNNLHLVKELAKNLN